MFPREKISKKTENFYSANEYNTLRIPSEHDIPFVKREVALLCVSREIDPILCEKCVEVPSYSKLTVQCCHAG